LFIRRSSDHDVEVEDGTNVTVQYDCHAADDDIGNPMAFEPVKDVRKHFWSNRIQGKRNSLPAP
jgi:hypothetical protein